MAVFHYVHLRAFAHETEDPARVAAAIRHAAQDELPLEETHAQGSHGNRILILEGELKSAPAVKRMFAGLLRDDAGGFDEIARSLRERVDENLNFHFRLDKQEACLGRVVLARGDDAITVRGKIRSFLSKRQGSALEPSLQQLEAFILGIQGRAAPP